MEGWQIALLIVGIILGIFLLFVIFDVVFVLSFNKLFKKHQKAMVIFLNMKYDNIKKLIDLMTSYGVEIDHKIIATVADIHREDFDNVENEACKKAQETLTYIKEELLYIARNQKSFQKHEEFIAAKENVCQLENQYRNTIAQYNADVLGYNYWINFWLTKWIWKAFKFKPKTLINI